MNKSGLVKEVFLILFISICVSIIVNYFHPDGLKLTSPYKPEVIEKITQSSEVSEWPAPLDINKAAFLHDDPLYLFVDARSEADYRVCHIKDAVNLPEHHFEQCLDEFMNKTDIQKSIITYCSSIDCPLAEHLAEKLFYMGFEKVYHLIGGLDTWQEKGLPVNLQ